MFKLIFIKMGKVSCKQMAAGEIVWSNKSSSGKLAFKPRQFHCRMWLFAIFGVIYFLTRLLGTCMATRCRSPQRPIVSNTCPIFRLFGDWEPLKCLPGGSPPFPLWACPLLLGLCRGDRLWGRFRPPTVVQPSSGCWDEFPISSALFISCSSLSLVWLEACLSTVFSFLFVFVCSF